MLSSISATYRRLTLFRLVCTGRFGARCESGNGFRRSVVHLIGTGRIIRWPLIGHALEG
jgi:hypothetical protein